MKIMLDTARYFRYILLHSRTGSPLPDTSFINNSFEPIMKTTLGTAAYGATRLGECKHSKLEEEILDT
jgi:hypothetical protein